MDKKFYGYVRVSTTEQNIARQLQELIKWGIVEKTSILIKHLGRILKEQMIKEWVKN